MMMDPAGIKWHERQEEKPARQTYPLPNHAHATHGSLLISLPHPSHNPTAAPPLLQDSVGTPAHVLHVIETCAEFLRNARYIESPTGAMLFYLQ
jgi:hypothetical protein